MKRIIAMLLAIVMLVGNVPVQAFAEEGQAQETISCLTEGCTLGAGHEGNCSNFVACETEGCEYAAGHEGNCSNYVEPSEDEIAAQQVVALINAIGEVSLGSEAVIGAADAAYNALTDAQKLLVTNLDVLEAAKAAYMALSIPAPVEDAIVLETGDMASYPADMYLSTIKLVGISGTVSGSGQYWTIELPEDMDTTQPITVELTPAVKNFQGVLRYWINDTCFEHAIVDANPVTVTYTPQWENGKATLVPCVGTEKKAAGTKYNIELSIKGLAKEDFNTVKLEETKTKNYFVSQFKLSGADATAFSVSDTDFSGSSSGHKATVEYSLPGMPSGPLTLTFTMMKDGGSYITCNGSAREQIKENTYTATIDLTQGTVFTFVTYSTQSNSTVRGTYTIKFKVAGAANAAPVLKDSSVTEVEQTITAGKTFNLDVAALFRDAEQDPLTYTVAINGAEPVEAAGSYSRLMDTAGDYTLVFRANDGNQTSEDSYTVKLKVQENTAPALTGEATAEATVMQYNAFKLDLSTIFADAEGDAMTYTVRVGDGAAQNAAVNYSYTPSEDGTVTLAFQAKDHALTSAEYTVTLTVTYAPRTTIDSTCTGKETGDTWMKSVTITGGEVIGYLWNVEAGHNESTEHVLRIRLADTVADDAVLQLAYSKGLAANGYAGTVSGPATVTLVDGEGSVKVTATGWLDNGVTKTYTLYFTNKANNAPVATPTSSTAEVNTGADFTIDLTTIFSDPDGDALTYTATIGEETVPVDAVYTRTMGTSGDITLVFTATDTWQATATHTVTVTVTQSEVTYDAIVNVPEGITPTFYTTDTFDGVNGDVYGDQLTASAGNATDGLIPYTVKVPENVSRISVRGVDGENKSWGGMCFEVSEDAAVSVRQVKLNALDYNNQITESTNTITYGETLAVDGEAGWLLAVGQEYIYKAVPSATDMVESSKTEILAAGSELYTVELLLDIKDPLNITVPTGAKAQLYQYKQYYSNTAFEAKRIKDNGDGTTTYSFIVKKAEPGMIYRVTMDGKITKAGWLDYNAKSVTVTYSDSDKSPDYRLNDYSGTGERNSPYTEDSVLLNINSRNHLSLSVGQTKVLKAYRAWEIIPVSYNNWIIPPDFTYTILSGSDVVSLAEKTSASAADGDWMTLTALQEGIAVIEVTYDAIDISGKDYITGVYGASDPARTGLVVVQVGGSNDDSVNFGIDCFTSIGKSGANNVSYNPDNKKAWDAEFDTLYFTGSSGELKLSPSASSAITEVAVSHDKGGSWTVLTGENGTYTATIVSGNNILRVKTASGTAYQVVRGDRISVSMKEVDGKSDGDGIVEAGETVRVSLIGLHNPIPKMAGNYNPGYPSNSDGYSSQHLNYVADGETIWGPGSQYNFITTSNYVQIVMPEDGSSVTLTNGYIGLGVIGLEGFADGGDSHRNIPDAGCGTRGSKTTFHTRSILPEITIEAGGESAPNTAPIVRADAATEGSIYDDQKFAINPDTLFQDADGDTLTFTVSVNGSAAAEIGMDYKFIPEAAGTYSLTFTASDGEETVQHTVTVTVTKRPQAEEPENNFGLDASEVAGYVTVSFEDNGVRVEGEKGLKFPVPLGTIIAPTKVPYKENENIAQVTKRLLDHLEIGMRYSGTLESGFYLGAITDFEVDGTPYATMGEFDAGTGSGWMITQNGTFINQGASEFKVQNGDILKWQYSCQLGADIGDNYYDDVNNTIKLIDEIGEVTLTSGEAIRTARAAYDKLSDSEKQRVSNYQKLTEAEEKYAELTKDAEDEAAADAVEAKIAAIGTASLDSEGKIMEARAAYNGLSENQKKLVENYSVLEAAEAALRLLKLDAEAIYRAAGDYLEKYETVPGVNSINGEWRVIGLARSGRPVQSGYYGNVVSYVASYIDSNERLHAGKSTDNSRVILALTALGYDVTSVAGHNLLAGLNDMDYVGNQGVNGYIWALIALDSHNYDPAGNVTRAKLINAILGAQKPDGGWATNQTSDPDMTGMAIQALAPYCGSQTAVKTAVEKAISWLAADQNTDGSFGKPASCESTVQVIVAMSALGIDVEKDSRFVKGGISALDTLCGFALEDGTFSHEKNGASNLMATEQAYYALNAYFRMKNNQKRLYDMTDVTIVKNKYQIIENANGIWKQDGGAFSLKSNADFAKFVGVKVDGVLINGSNYTASEGSTVVTFKAEYLKTLSLGVHTITVVSSDGESATLLTIARSDAEEAKQVEDLIAAIGAVTKDSGQKIKDARDAYDKLSDEQKALVKNYSTLTAAEKAYEDLATKITVYFTLLGDSNHGNNGKIHTLAEGGLSTWIPRTPVTVKKPATVWDVFQAAVNGRYSYTNRGNYISSINGLSEFSNGTYSGWMYTLNGSHPSLGVEQQSVSDGNDIVFHYTDDYRLEEGGYGSGSTVTAQEVIRLINAIGTVTLEDEDAVRKARDAYNALSEDQKAQVYNYDILTDAETKLGELLVQDAINQINAIGTVTLRSGSKIDDAWNAYNKLSVEQKAKVTNFSKLVKAQDTYNTLRVNEVKDLIDELDAVTTLESEEKITAARKAYNALSEAQKGLLPKEYLEKLKAAELALAELKATETDRKKAKEVMDLIEKLEKITLDSEEDILAARQAYDKLTEIQKALVTNYEQLEAAEKKLAELKRMQQILDIHTATGDYLLQLGNPGVGSVGGEWMVIGLSRSGRKLADEDAYYEAVVQFVRENADGQERLHNAKSTENSRIILALTALGKDVTNVDGHNLLKGLNDLDYLLKQGINGPIWALIALDSGNYPVPEGNVTRSSLIDTILAAQHPDGGWSLAGTSADPDMTGMALQALAPYYRKNENVTAAVDSALQILSLMQYGNGSFAGIDGESSESLAQVIVALSALGIDADTDARFVKNGVSALQALLNYAVSGGGFRHIPEGNRDGMATEQCYYALTAYFRMLERKTSLYDMTDVMDLGGDPLAESVYETAAAVPAETVTEEGENAVIIWIGVAALSTAAIVVILLNRKKFFGKFL